MQAKQAYNSLPVKQIVLDRSECLGNWIFEFEYYLKFGYWDLGFWDGFQINKRSITETD